MKTIDFLVQELPKLGGWPEGATGAGCLCGEGTLYFWDEHGYCQSKWMIDTDTGEIEDTESEISRERYEASLAAKNDGWIEWGGGECPVPCGTTVDVKHRCGAVSENQQAWPKRHKESNVIVNPLSNAGQAFWRHENSVMDIIAYRLHKPQEAEQFKADDEADLNECIGQTHASVWNGEGLPPIGCECEVSVDGGRSWCTYRAINEKNGARLIEVGNFTEEFQNNNWIFRHTLSEAERKREEAAQALCNAGGGNGKVDEKSGYGSCWFDIYDAIAAGKIPGVKLED